MKGQILKLIPRDNGSVILAYGEVTGHAHRIVDEGAELYALDNTDDRFLKIMSSVRLVHEEHDTVVLEPDSPARDPRPLRQGDVLLIPTKDGYITRIKRVYVSADMPAIAVQD